MSKRPPKIEVTDRVHARVTETARRRGLTVSKLIDEALDVAEATERSRN